MLLPLLRMISGLEKPDSGKIYLNGKLANENKGILIPSSQREIGFIFQDLALWPHFTVYENIAFGLTVKKADKTKSKISEILDFFAIDGHRNKYPSQLSGGQQQLVAIARSLVLNPKILLMDEPLANLDVKLKSKIRNQIRQLINNFSVTIIYVTHDHHEAFNLADEIVVLNNGKIEETGTPDEIKKSENAFVKEFIEI
ncbi:MAG TPA: ABC transporter ATP-binding protein [bacterium]|nr:ABC transporter ATP-binding protein [bacterium]